MQEIRDWLNSNQDYAKGVAILQQLDAEAAKLLTTGHQRPQQLFVALRSKLGRPVVVAVAKNDPLVERAAPMEPVRYSTGLRMTEQGEDPNNEVAEEALRTAKKLFKEMSNVRALLFQLCPEKASRFENEAGKLAERAELTKQVMELQYKVDEAYRAYEFAQENGRLPELTTVATVEDVDLHRVTTNCRKRINKLKNMKLRTPEQSERLEKEELLLVELLAKMDAQ